MVNGLDVVAVGIEHEGAVVVWMVVRTQSGGAIVDPAGRDRRFIKSADRLPMLRGKGDMRSSPRIAPQRDPEEEFWTGAITDGMWTFRVEPRDPQGTQGAIIECLRPLEVADADGDVVQHGRPSPLTLLRLLGEAFEQPFDLAILFALAIGPFADHLLLGSHL